VSKPHKEAADAQTAKPDRSEVLSFASFLFANVVDWYKNADAKAQIILTLDGALVTFLTTSVFRKPTELAEVTQKLTSVTWLLLISMCLCLVGSIVSALMCLWSRVFLGSKRDIVLGRERRRIKEGVRPYSPSVMLFFKTISWLDHDTFQEQVGTTDIPFQVKALASQTYLLSKRVYRKHVLVNAGFVLAGASLIFFLASGVSYLANVK
jgi:hypothetical protein